MQRFAGLPRAHGTYALGQNLSADKKGKLTGPRKTVHEPVTAEKWEAHLAGVAGIGIVPIRTDNMVVFGAIDIDDYTIDLSALNKKIQAMKLPLIVCRTKSGGAHLYCFSAVPVKAETMRTKLMEWAIALGHAGVEVFPKQISLAGEDDPVEASTGNWINMPYADAERTMRYALDPVTNDALSAEQFLQLADQLAVPSEEELSETNPPADDIGELLAGAPPCLQTMCRNGVPEGGRNNFMFNMCKYLQNRYGEDFHRHTDLYNQRFCSPPLGAQELLDVVKSLRKKKYGFTCKQPPFSTFCNKQVCQTREFGIGGLPDDPGVVFGELVKLQGGDEASYIWTINGKRIEMDLKTLMNQKMMHERVVATLDIWPDTIKDATYKAIVKGALAKVEKIEVPEDATREGQLWVQLSRFCTGRVVAREFDEILRGLAYTDTKEKVTYFQAADFLEFLHQRRITAVIGDVYRFLRRRGAGHAFKNLKGKGVNLWTIPAFDEQTQDFNVPVVKPPEKM